jgi:hypothetical protein
MPFYGGVPIPFRDAGVDGRATDASSTRDASADGSTEDAGPPCGDGPACGPPYETCVTSSTSSPECCHVEVTADAGVSGSCRPCEGDACATSAPVTDATTGD